MIAMLLPPVSHVEMARMFLAGNLAPAQHITAQLAPLMRTHWRPLHASPVVKVFMFQPVHLASAQTTHALKGHLIPTCRHVPRVFLAPGEHSSLLLPPVCVPVSYALKE